MPNQIRIGQVGLSENEIKVLKSIFHLTPLLTKNYRLTEPSELDSADIVLVNIDSPLAVKQWDKLEQVNQFASPIALSTNDRTIDGMVSLKSPIQVQHLIGALEDVVSDRSIFSIPDDGLTVGMDLNVLIVNERYPVRKYIKHKLAELTNIPINFSFADSSEQAMTKLDQKSYDLVFLDDVIEGADGCQLCDMIKSKYYSYVVMLSSNGTSYDKLRGKLSGYDAYIAQPLSVQHLFDELQNCLIGQCQTQNNFTEIQHNLH